MKITSRHFNTLQASGVEQKQHAFFYKNSSPAQRYLIGFVLTVMCIVLILIVPFVTCAQVKSKPNVILIITDDQGYGDIGFHGNPDIKTPVLDQLAKTSTRFTSFYVSPVCAPTRSSLMTGRYSLRTGVHDTYNGGAIMATQEITMAELMKKAGYKTSIIGKWHLGDNYPFRPMEQGFDESLVHGGGGIGQTGDFYNYYRKDSSYFDATLVKNGIPVKTTGYCSDVYTDAALHFLEGNHKKPFFLYLAFNAPHEPLQVPQKYLDMYKGLIIDSSHYKNQKGFPKMSEKNQADARKVYSMITNIDDNLGRLFKKLEQLKLDSNTLVIFMTDNGPQQLRYKDGLRAIKGSVYDGGVKVPFYIKMPGTLDNDKEIKVPAAHFDVLPTLAELCGFTLPAGVKIDGKSLVPLLRNSDAPWKERAMVFNWARGYPEPYRNIAVRKGKYKMVGMCDENAAPAALELYDLENDPNEMKNISKANAGKLSELRLEFDNWYKEIIQSPHLVPQAAIIGTKYENPTVLNRNDCMTYGGVWEEDKNKGYWEVALQNSGKFDFNVSFKTPIPSATRLFLRIGNIQRSVDIKSGERAFDLKGINVPKGKYRVEAWVNIGEDYYLPMAIQVNHVTDQKPSQPI